MLAVISWVAAIFCLLLALFGVSAGIDLAILGLILITLGLIFSHLGYGPPVRRA